MVTFKKLPKKLRKGLTQLKKSAVKKEKAATKKRLTPISSKKSTTYKVGLPKKR